MKKRTVSEEELRSRLAKSGKTEAEIDSLINRYVGLPEVAIPNENAISNLLKKTQGENILRVKGFVLTKEQYDTLAGYFQDVNKEFDYAEPSGSQLVRAALHEFLKLIS